MARECPKNKGRNIRSAEIKEEESAEEDNGRDKIGRIVSQLTSDEKGSIMAKLEKQGF